MKLVSLFIGRKFTEQHRRVANAAKWNNPILDPKVSAWQIYKALSSFLLSDLDWLLSSSYLNNFLLFIVHYVDSRSLIIVEVLAPLNISTMTFHCKWHAYACVSNEKYSYITALNKYKTTNDTSSYSGAKENVMNPGLRFCAS